MMNTKQLLEQIEKMYHINAIKRNQTNKEDLDAIKNRVSDDTFRIAVVGEFSSGKSTFINALIQSDLLTHAVNETTATITKIHNVKENDDRLGTGVVEYRSGKKITIDNMTKLYEYTTAQSSRDVANMVLNVSVYVHFMDSAYPIVIIDTPGLNGIADKHREITIEEVKKAHACIYLLSAKGITNSDVDFIRILQNYQSKFIFVQNFIDQLKSSEGETEESKIAADIKLIEKNLKSADGHFDYDICGISALKKLCAKDLHIKKLYSDDLNELTMENRKRLDAESHFSDFEKCISNLVLGEKYKEIVIYSAVQALDTLIDKTLANVMKRQEINAELQRQDEKTKRIQKAQQIISQIEYNRENCRKKLANFIISRDKENRQGLKEYATHRLQGIYENVCEEINRRIQNYEDFESFEFVEKKSIPDFYAMRTTNMINSDVIPEIDERISDNLSHLYDEAAQRVMEIATNFSGKNEKIEIKIQAIREKLKINDKDYRTQINQYQSELKEKLVASNKINEEIAREHQERTQAEANRKNEEQQKQSDEYTNHQKIKALGRKPDVEKRTERRVRYEERHGFFNKLFHGFQDKRVEYDEVVYDDSKQREWIKKYNEYTNYQQRQAERHNQRISALNSQISSLNSKIKINEGRSSKIRDEIQDLEGRIKRESQIYENALKQNQREFCEAQKKKLKNLLQNSLFDRTESECTIEKLEWHIDHMSDTYIKPIGEQIERYYKESIGEQIAELTEIINENASKLEEQYNADEKDITELIKIKDILKENGI